MSPAWLDQWLRSDAPVFRRAKADVEKKNGGGGASLDELVDYLSGRPDGPFTLLETADYYIVIRGESPQLRVHLGSPTFSQ